MYSLFFRTSFYQKTTFAFLTIWARKKISANAMRLHKYFSYFYMCIFMKSLKRKKKKLERKCRKKYNKQNSLFFEKWCITQIQYTERGICFDF